MVPEFHAVCKYRLRASLSQGLGFLLGQVEEKTAFIPRELTDSDAECVDGRVCAKYIAKLAMSHSKASLKRPLRLSDACLLLCYHEKNQSSGDERTFSWSPGERVDWGVRFVASWH